VPTPHARCCAAGAILREGIEHCKEVTDLLRLIGQTKNQTKDVVHNDCPPGHILRPRGEQLRSSLRIGVDVRTTRHDATLAPFLIASLQLCDSRGGEVIRLADCVLLLDSVRDNVAKYRTVGAECDFTLPSTTERTVTMVVSLYTLGEACCRKLLDAYTDEVQRENDLAHERVWFSLSNAVPPVDGAAVVQRAVDSQCRDGRELCLLVSFSSRVIVLGDCPQTSLVSALLGSVSVPPDWRSFVASHCTLSMLSHELQRRAK